MLEFRGKNFQCWPDFSIKVEGLTLIVGPSNHGKSAITRALRGIFRNDAGEGSIRYESQDISLDVKVDNHHVAFTRELKGSPEYRIDGKRFTKLNRGLPPGIEKLGFNEIEIGTFHFDPIFAGQFDSPFLLAASPQELNAALGAFASTEKLEIGKKEAGARVAVKNQEAKALAGEIADAEARRSRLEQLQLCVEAVAESLTPLEQEASLLSNLAVYTRGTITAKESLEPLKHVLAHLQLPDFHDVEKAEELQHHLEIALGSRCALGSTRKVLTALDAVAIDWSQIVAVYRRKEQLETALQARQNAARQTAKGINAVIGEVEDVLAGADVVKQIVLSLREAINLQELHAESSRRVKAHALEYDQAIAQVDAAEAEFQAAQLIECPKCHHKFSLINVCEEV